MIPTLHHLTVQGSWFRFVSGEMRITEKGARIMDITEDTGVADTRSGGITTATKDTIAVTASVIVDIRKTTVGTWDYLMISSDHHCR